MSGSIRGKIFLIPALLPGQSVHLLLQQKFTHSAPWHCSSRSFSKTRMKSGGDDLIPPSPDGEISILLIVRPVLFILFYFPYPVEQRTPQWFGWENSSRSTPPMDLKIQLDKLSSDHPFFNFNGIFHIRTQAVNSHYFVSINTETPQIFSAPSPLETRNSSRVKTL